MKIGSAGRIEGAKLLGVARYTSVHADLRSSVLSSFLSQKLKRLQELEKKKSTNFTSSSN